MRKLLKICYKLCDSFARRYKNTFQIKQDYTTHDQPKERGRKRLWHRIETGKYVQFFKLLSTREETKRHHCTSNGPSREWSEGKKTTLANHMQTNLKIGRKKWIRLLECNVDSVTARDCYMRNVEFLAIYSSPFGCGGCCYCCCCCSSFLSFVFSSQNNQKMVFYCSAATVGCHRPNIIVANLKWETKTWR